MTHIGGADDPLQGFGHVEIIKYTQNNEEYFNLNSQIIARVPLIVNKDGFLLDGHHRYRACKELGIEK